MAQKADIDAFFLGAMVPDPTAPNTAPRKKLLSLDNITNSTLIKFNGKLRPRNLHLEMNLDYDEEKGVYVEISQKG